MKNILLVDDDPAMRRLLRSIFEPEGFAVFEAGNGATAYDVLNDSDISIVLLDLVLGTEDGLEIGRKICRRKDVPIVMVTAKGDDIDRVVGLEIGADDYIVKPFNVREVLARVRAVLRRAHRGEVETNATRPPECYYFGDFEFNITARSMTRLGNVEPCPELTAAEFDLMEVFLRHPNQVLSREALLYKLGGATTDATHRSIDTLVARLRKKMEPTPAHPESIKTIRGVGYLFSCPVVKR
jgi:two-component system OmpR family response regulator